MEMIMTNTNTTPRAPRPVYGLPPVPVCAAGVERAYRAAIELTSVPKEVQA
jgi:hypothetical protein